MWYLLYGNFVSSLLFIILLNSLKNLNYLSDFELSVGWFLIEHVFEEYNLTTGKFFLVSKDFRTLIKNFIMIIRNIIFLAQLFTPLEFIIINVLLLCTLILFKKTKFYNKLKILVLFSYYFLFKSFVFFDYYLISTLCSNFFLMILNLMAISLYVFILYCFLTLTKGKLKQIIQLVLIKIFLYLFVMIINFILISLLIFLLFSIKNQENILHEFSLNILIIYSYLLYYI